jgi:hypothetical protein
MWFLGFGFGLTSTGVGAEAGVPIVIVSTLSTVAQGAACAGGGALIRC